MHRVYNSAFMNMLRDEENAKYRSYLKKTIEFDPDIMKRYVNFMSNPDERTAIDQFGSGDKFFGTATMLSTLPGLPMFAHGQIEGYGERYGMEFKQAKMEEWPNEGLVARHNQVIAPLLKQRYIFAESENFVLYDFWHEFGGVDENVFAYSNRFQDKRSLIFYNNRYEGTRGSIHISAASMDKGSGELRQTSLTSGMALSADSAVTLAYRDLVSGLEYLRRASDLAEHGFTLDLRGYQYVVFLNWRELRSTAEHPWDRLCDSLGGRGVHSVDEALLKLRFASVYDALRQVISSGNTHFFAELARLGLAGSAKKAAIDAPITQPVSEPPLDEAISIEDQIKLDPQPSGHSVLDTDLDPRLESFLNASITFFERVRENLPDQFIEQLTPAPETTSATKQTPSLDPSAQTERSQADLLTRFRQACTALTMAAVQSPALNKLEEQGWAPVLSWIVLSSLPSAYRVCARRRRAVR